MLTNNVGGGRLATQHLIELGHRRIACITGLSEVTPSAEQITGFRQALEESGIPVDEALILSAFANPPLTTIVEPQYEQGVLATEMLLERMRDPDEPQGTRFWTAVSWSANRRRLCDRGANMTRAKEVC